MACKLKNRLGEINKMNNGQAAKIIEYNNSLDVVIQFEDGTIVNTRYDHFKDGGVKNPTLKESRIGKVNKMNNGLQAKVIAYRNSADIDVQFEDGIIVKNKDYGNFKKGNIKHPYIKVASRKPNVFHINESRVMNNGQMAKIITYKKNDDIDVQFEDGTIRKSVQYSNFKNGTLSNPNFKKKYKQRANHINETKIMNCGMSAIIIDYRKSSDIDVQFKDGTIVKNKQYSCFNRGTIENPNCKTKRKTLKDVRVGKINIMNNGHPAQIIDYRTSADIDVCFEDGIIVEHTSYNSFLNGSIANPNDKAKGSSLQEYTCLYYLEKYEFKKLTRFISHKKFEIDVFNERLGAVEYDGRAWHRKKEKNDNDKNRLYFELYGNRLIRIREKGLPKLNDKYCVEYFLMNDKPFSIEYQSLLKELYLNEFNLKIDVDFERDKEEICRKFYSHCYHLGETKEMNCGKNAEIIIWRGTGNIDVKFEDGTIVSHCQYSNFKRGTINPFYFSDRTGETKIMKNGMRAEIIEYRKFDDIDIMFEDGSIVRNIRYQNFKNGTIMHPKKKEYLNPNNRIGQCKRMNNGQCATIVSYRNCDDIDVQFEDGTIVNTRFNSFKNCKISNPNLKKNRIIDNKGRFGEQRVMHCGMMATIIEYRKWDDIDVQFEDGTIIKHRQYTGFKNGTIANKKSHN